MVDQTVVTAPSGPEPVRVVRRRVRSAELGYEPALDGLRALAVTAVLFFHARFAWIPGGFLGVSTFFTLSGFLITTLMLGEWGRSGGLDLRRFYTRRFRRLLPASWMTLLLVVLMGALGVWDAGQLRSLRGDVPASLAEVSNWWFILQDRSYGALFESPSPLEHFWSLAVEQQFYLLYPLVLVGALLLARRLRGAGPLTVLVPLLVALTVISATLNGIDARTSIPRAYFGTDTRLAELVIGGLLACVGVRRLRMLPGRRGVALAGLGVLALVGSAALWHVATVSTGWLYPFGLLVTALCSVGLIVGALQTGPLRALLTWAPVVAFGRISYGVYLLHWPIFLWLTPARTGLAEWPLFALRMAVTTLAAVAMYQLLERPTRAGRLLPSRPVLRLALPAAAVILILTAVVTWNAPPPQALAAALETTTTLPPAPAPLRTLIVGDETAGVWGADATGSRDLPLAPSTVSSSGCGLAVGGFVELPDGTVERNSERCGPLRDLWLAAIAERQPEVVVVSSGLRDVANRRLESKGPWLAPGDAKLDDFLTLEVRDTLDSLTATGTPVLLATIPHVRNSVQPPPPPPPMLPSDARGRDLVQTELRLASQDAPASGFPENDPARIDRWNEILRTAAAQTGVPILDVAAAMQQWPGGEFDPERRAADGVGVTPLGQQELSAALAEQIRSARPAVAAPDAAATSAASVPLPPAPPVTPRRTVPVGTTADVLVVGDSVGLNVGTGLRETSVPGADLDVAVGAKLGCPIARGGSYKFLRDIEEFSPECDWSGFFPAYLDAYDPAVVVLTSGIWEVVDRRLPGDDRFRQLGDPVSDRYFLAELLSAIDALSSRGASVVLLTYPHVEAGQSQGFSGLPESDPARIDRANELIREAAAQRPGVATVVDFGGWLAEQPGGELDTAKRSDGVHFTDEFVPQIGAWLAPQVDAVARAGVAPPAG